MNPLTDRVPPRVNDSARAFTLIEFIGVVAVLAILAAMVLPTVIKRLDHAAWTRETSDLTTISNGLTTAILRNRQIPNIAGMTQAISASIEYSVPQVQKNGRGYSRVFMIDPGFTISGGLPYTQTYTGCPSLPTEARVLIVSTIATPLPSISATDFDEIWSTPNGSIPSPLAAWGGKGEDLLVQRVELGSLFRKVVLINIDPLNIGRYSVDESTMVHVPTATRVMAYFLDGTVLNFFHHNSTLDCRQIIHEDSSFVYQNNRWSRRLTSDDDVIGSFGQLVAEFLRPPPPSDPKFASTQQAVVDLFYDYLWGYAVWAFGDPMAIPPVIPFAGSGEPNTPQFPSYTVVYQSQITMADFTDNLIH